MVDTRTIGRYAHPSRTQQVIEAPRRPQVDEPMFMFFDGKTFTPVGKQRISLDLFSGYGSIAAVLRPGKLHQHDWDWARAYAQSGYVFRGVEMVAQDVSRIPHGVQRRTSKQDWPEHPLNEALKWARRTNRQDILSLWQKALYVFGENYLVPISNGFAHPSSPGRAYYNGIQWLNPLVVEPVILGNELRGWDYTAYGMERLRVNEVVYDQSPSILDDIRGQSRVSAALSSINIALEVKRFTLDSFLKDMRTQGVITGRAGSNLSQGDVDRVVELLKEQVESRLIGIPQSVEYTSIQHKWDDTQFKANDEALREIAAALGIPLSVLGAWFSATYQSAPAQIQFYYENVIFAELDRLTVYINDVLLPYYDPYGEGEWYFDKDAALSLIEDKPAKVAMLNSRVANGNLTINEMRVKLGDEPIDGGDVLILSGQLVPLSQLKTMAQQSVAPLPDMVAPALPPAPVPEKAVEPVEQPGMKSAALMLTLPNNPDLIQLQNRVRSLVGETPCEWNAPDDFHITLVYAPAITDEQLAALQEALDEVEVPLAALRVGSLGVNDNVGEHALHFKIRYNEELYELQETLYELCEALGIPLSSYSRPDAYKPHITMGYAKNKLSRITFNSKLMVKATTFCLKVGDEMLYARALGELKADEVKEDEKPSPPFDGKTLRESEGVISVVSIHEAALDELEAWRKKVKNKGAAKALEFKTYLIRDEVADDIRKTLGECEDEAMIKAIFENARAIVSVKAIQSTRIDFEDAFADLLDDALKGKVTRRQFQGRLKSLLELYIYKAYVDGLRDGGVDEDPDSEEQAEINQLISRQNEYISGLGATIYKDEDTVISGAVAEQKPAMWFNKSVNPAYQAGLAAADGNGMYEWVYGSTEHCEDCQRLNGQKHRMKEYKAKDILPKSDKLACKGFNCKCNLVKTTGKAKGSW